MQQMVAHGVRDFIEELCNLLVRLALHALKNLVEQVDIVPAAGFNDLFSRRCALRRSVIPFLCPSQYLTSASAIFCDLRIR